jgi:hypothetical protein
VKRILLALTILLGFQTYAFSQPLPSYSLWQNKRGSTLEITYVSSDGSFQGTFINRAEGFQCKGIPYGATGMTRNNAVFFSVMFVKCISETIWYGTVTGNTMTTKWILVYTVPSGPPQTMPGTDVFTRIR